MERRLRGIHVVVMPFVFRAILAIVLFLSLPIRSLADGTDEVDEIPVSIRVRGIGKAELPALIINQKAYLSIADLFDFLKIKNEPSFNADSISGFFINPNATYLVDATHNRITLQNKSFNVDKGAMICRNHILYLRTDYFGIAFGLNCIFNLRAVTIDLKSTIELPSVREKRLEGIRRNLIKLKGNVKADTTVKAPFHLFHFGTADWAVASSHGNTGLSDVRLHLGIGASIAGGEATALLNYDRRTGVRSRDQFYQWRYVNNDAKAVRRVLAGKIYVPSISSIYGPVTGVQISNAPTTFRRSFGSYTISDFTKPGWTVELYVNNVLVEYRIADASGYYSFEVPLVYGASAIMLRFYGLNGEEGKREENVYVPFSFLPKNTFEYTASGGIAENNNGAVFSRLSMGYGVSQKLTVGGGYEYLAGARVNQFMPFINASALLMKDLLFTADYLYGVRGRAILACNLPKHARLELNYTKYSPGQTVISNNYLEERKILFSVPVHLRSMVCFSRMQVRQIILPFKNYISGEWILSGNILGINTHMGTYVSYFDDVYPNTYTNLSFGIRLPHRFTLTPQVQYDYRNKAVSSIVCQLEKKIKRKCYLNISYNQNNVTRSTNYGFGFRYDFSFAQFESAAYYNDGKYTVSEAAGGSLMYDRKSHLLKATSRSNQGKGGVSVCAFLDINCNGKRDPGEHKVQGFKFRINTGRIVCNAKDTIFYMYNLEPYQSYFIEPDVNSFDNIAWRVKKQIIGAAVAANQVTQIDIPIAVVGEISGSVVLNGNQRDGISRIIIYVYDADWKQVGRILTEEDGRFDYIGLAPGNYTLQLDEAQLGKLKYMSPAKDIPFEIRKSEDGDIVSNLSFSLTHADNQNSIK